DTYARVVSGRASPSGTDWEAVGKDETGLDLYRHEYLPNEILHWGGDLGQMFPDTCLVLTRGGVALNDFVAWWFDTARISAQPYDFFHLKIDRFVRFVHECADTASPVVEREATLLRQAYAEANDTIQPLPMTEANR
ncbi:MAG TPA: hypothetical protein VIU63_02985, partial [Nitrospira sp.]